jgi:hypothetical protein
MSSTARRMEVARRKQPNPSPTPGSQGAVQGQISPAAYSSQAGGDWKQIVAGPGVRVTSPLGPGHKDGMDLAAPARHAHR